MYLKPRLKNLKFNPDTVMCQGFSFEKQNCLYKSRQFINKE